MRKQNKVRRLTLLTAMFIAALAHAGVFDDAAFWVRGFRDGNDDGLVAGGTDVPDARNANASANVMASGVAASRIWREETVVCPYSGETFTAPCCYLAQTANETDNLSFCANFSVTDAERVAVTNGMGTVVARVRPELGLVDSASWLTGGIGFQLGFRKSGDDRLELYGNYSWDGDAPVTTATGFTVATNTWVDVAMVRDGEGVRLYAATNGFTFTRSFDPRELTKVADTFYFGHFQGTKSYGTALASYKNCFRGSVHQIALWNRALSEREIREAFAFPRTDILRVGIANGSSNEFGLAVPEASSANPEDWYSVPASLPRGATATFAFSVPLNATNLSQCLRLATTSASQSGSVTAVIDGQPLPTLETSPQATSIAMVPSELMTAGPHTLALTRTTDGTTYLDALSLGGSIQLGAEDNNKDEYGVKAQGAPISAYVEDCNLKNFAQVIEQSTTNEWKIVLPADLAARCRWQYEVRAFRGKGDSTYAEKPLRVALLVNGTVVEETSFVQRFQTFSVNLPAGLLREGENTLGFTNRTPAEQLGYYAYLDCVRLKCAGEVHGFVISFR